MKSLLCLLIIPLALIAEEGPIPNTFDPLLQTRKETHVAFNNRPLARVMGQTISLFDVVKKMNLFLHQHYPQAFESRTQLYQFYVTNWRPTLDEMINNRLIILEAEERELTVSDGDVRQEMEDRFGPNIMISLNELGLGYEEARQMIHDEIAVRQMSYFKIHSKAMQEVTPNKVKDQYIAYKQAHPQDDKWTYQMLTIRGDDPDVLSQASKRAEELLASGIKNLKETADNLQGEFDSAKITVSNDISMSEKHLSKANRSILSSLATGEISPITEQKSRGNGPNVYRLFHLKDHQVDAAADFDDVSTDLKDQLLRKHVEKHHTEYVAQLKAKYQYETNIPADYQPFISR